MHAFNGAVLGLGLFFLGLQLAGQNMRALAGGGFRTVARGATSTPVSAALCGIAAGALMQSATAVTFVLSSMLGSGVVQAAGAAVAVVWCNAGLTALAFLAASNIHPYVALLVGAAGIAMGSIRKKPWNSVAGALLGVGIILYGLEELGAGLAPLRDEGWFQAAVEHAVSSPLKAFLAGIAMAALLQSNTGATMVLIALAESGALGFGQAVPAVYGTNLGAIALRAFLARGLKGPQLRLVRLEDLFCVFGGLAMMALLAAERGGVPLVEAFVLRIADGDAVRLALVFLFSNLVPAALLSPFLPACWRLLERLWPTVPGDEPGRPKYLAPQALADPPTALDLVSRELGRLFGLMEISARPAGGGDTEANESPAQAQLGAAIEQFCARLASESPLTRAQSLRLQRLRAWLHTLRHIGEAAGEASAALAELPVAARKPADPLAAWVRANIQAGADAISGFEPEKVRAFHELSKTKAPAFRAMREDFGAAGSATGGPDAAKMAAVLDNFDILAWLIHRLAKLQMKALPPQGVRVGPPSA